MLRTNQETIQPIILSNGLLVSEKKLKNYPIGSFVKFVLQW